jgi:alanine racemase
LKSWIEISAARLRANLAAIQASIGPDFDPLCVIKANAYGHSAALCAPVLVAAGAHWLGVGDLEEGTRVRHALDAAGLRDRNTHILVMCGMEPDDAPGLIEYQLTPVIWTPEHVHALERAAAQTNQRIAVHLELDTGMARQGAAPGPELAALLQALRPARHVRAEGLFSHLSSSEVAGAPITGRQQERFHQAFAQVLDSFLPEIIHFANTSGIDERSTLPWLRSATAQFGARLLVRPGLALYGYTLPLEGHSAADRHLGPHLQPVGTWKTRIIGLREIAPGDTVGYGATFTAEHPMRLALFSVGYADGFRREASSGVGNGWVVIHGQRAPVVGRVSMNLTVVDVTNLYPPPALGDEVTLLGEGVTAQDHAAWCGTIPYEILCGMRGHHRLVV